MTSDDRADFEASRREDARRMRDDRPLAADALALTAAADRHNWSYQWDWLGLPVIQMPTDIVVLQEIIWSCRPQLVIETGVARGGSLILSASLLELLGEGEVLGIDVDIREHNRSAIEHHPLSKRVTLFEGSSIATEIVELASARAQAVDRVMVILDSNHSNDHVSAELEAYAPLVSVGQFLVVADTVIEELPVQDHRPRSWGPGNSPGSALRAWLAGTDGYEPDPFLNAKLLLSASRGGYLRRVH